MRSNLRNPEPTVIREGITAVTGPNGAGKSLLGRIIERGWNFATNRITSPRGKLKIRMVEFSDIHSLAGCRAGYYQQRYESSMNDAMPTVSDVIGRDLTASAGWRQLTEAFNLHDAKHKRINFLSSGELRKILIINQLLDLPDLLILDNPFIGLDAPSRTALAGTLRAIPDSGTSVMLLTPDNDIDFADHHITVNAGTVGATPPEPTPHGAPAGTLPGHAPQPYSGTVVELDNCSVAYGNRTIISDLDWTVRAGETWALTGPNGSGKSTLLSLIAADNPQAYRNRITLFGRRRGTGESIWDIKRRIGYVSPEMHMYFNGGLSTVESIVAHGLHDTVGEFTRISESERKLAREWLGALDMTAIADRPFNALSAGEQRLTLLARTFVKRPQLLILDEPLHGLDATNRQRVGEIVDRMTSDSTTIYVTHNPCELPTAVTATKNLTNAETHSATAR